MATSWNDTVELVADQTATAYAECVMHDENEVHLRLSILDPELEINCYRRDRQFVCSHDATDVMVSVCEVMMVNTVEPTFLIEVRFMALAAGTSDVTFSIVSGSADIENAVLTAN